MWGTIGMWSAATAHAQTAITQPTTITSSGSFLVTQDIVTTFCSQVIVIDADFVTLDLGGHTLECIAGNPNSRVISINGRTGIRIRNGHLRGADFGIRYIAGSANDNGVFIDIRNVNIREAIMWGIHIEPAPFANTLDIVNIRDNHIVGPGFGIHALAATGQIVDNIVSTEDLALDVANYRGLLVADNTLRTHARAVQAQNAANIMFRENTVRSQGNTGIELVNTLGSFIYRNYINGLQYGITLDANSSANAIDWNHFPGALVGVEIAVGASDNLLSNNRSLVYWSGVGVLGGSGTYHDAGGNIVE